MGRGGWRGPRLRRVRHRPANSSSAPSRKPGSRGHRMPLRRGAVTPSTPSLVPPPYPANPPVLSGLVRVHRLFISSHPGFSVQARHFCSGTEPRAHQIGETKEPDTELEPRLQGRAGCNFFFLAGNLVGNFSHPFMHFASTARMREQLDEC